MKKIILVLTLIVGVGIGWGISTYQTQRSFEKRYQEAWDPEFQNFVKEIGSIGAVLEETVTAEELHELLRSIVELGNKMSTDGNARSFWQAQQAFSVKKRLEIENIDSASSYLQSHLEYFVKKYDEGDFENDINEEMASELATVIKSANQ